MDDAAPISMVPLGHYEIPTLPTDETLQKIWADLKRTFQSSKDSGPLLSTDALDRTTFENRDRIAPRPGVALAVRALDAELSGWLTSDDANDRLRVIVMPPHGEVDPVTLWSERRDCDVLPTIARASLMAAAKSPDLSGDGLLVIPRLEDWFVRHEHGLATLSRLVETIVECDRKILIGCNSWAWEYLSRVTGTALTLPHPLTFSAMDGPTLETWIEELSAPARTDGLTLRLASDGSEISGSETNEAVSAYFVRLAAHSLGIPWVAWAIWRASARDFHPDSDSDTARAVDLNDPDTYWVIAPSGPALPPGHERDALLVLHTLLIHGALEPDLIERLLPIVDVGPVLSAMIVSGFLRQTDSALTVASDAYPTARTALNDAGFPMDKLST